MSETKHTPGPWERGGASTIYEPGTKERIAEAAVAWKSSSEAAANADLIAASPQFLAALLQIVETHACSCADDSGHDLGTAACALNVAVSALSGTRWGLAGYSRSGADAE